MTDKEKHPEIGKRIRTLRENQGLEQLELAKKLGYKSQSTISKWESGVNLPTGKKLISLAKILNTNTDVILGQNSEQEPVAETPQYRSIQRKAKALSVEEQERLLKIMDLTFHNLLGEEKDDGSDL